MLPRPRPAQRGRVVLGGEGTVDRTKTLAPICPSLNLEVRKSLERGKAAGRGQSLPVVGVEAGMEGRALARQERCAKPVSGP